MDERRKEGFVMAHAAVPPRIRRVQASALVLLVIAGTLNYVCAGNDARRVEKALSLADGQYGYPEHDHGYSPPAT